MTRDHKAKFKKRVEAKVRGKEVAKIDGRHNPRCLVERPSGPLSVRLSDSDREILTDYAVDKGVPLATLLRHLLILQIKNHPTDDNIDPSSRPGKGRKLIEYPARSLTITMSDKDVEILAKRGKRWGVWAATYARMVFRQYIKNGGKLHKTGE